MGLNMSKLPFEKFIITFLLLNKDIGWIVEKAKEFGYCVSPAEVKELFDDLRDTLPPAIKQEVNERVTFTIDKPEHAQWLEHFEIAEFYDFLLRKNERLKEPPPYFKWFRDIVWMHNNQDVLAIVNIFIFNGEPLESISDVISFKYKKKIGIDTLKIHQRIFWNTALLSATEALYHCLYFRSNALIIKKIRGSSAFDSATVLNNDQTDGSEISFVFHDNNYIKWKIGYPVIRVPTAKDFLEKVKTDSYYKYYEAMNMDQSIEVEEEEGTSAELGDYDRTKTRRRNVEEQRARAAKHWMELFVKADKAIPNGAMESDDFFKKMDQLELDFGDADEKIVSIDNAKDILTDIRNDVR